MNPGELATMKMTLNLYPVHWRKQRLSYLKMEIPLHLSSDIFRYYFLSLESTTGEKSSLFSQVREKLH